MFAWHALMASSGLAPNAVHSSGCTIIRRSDFGALLTPASTARFFTPAFANQLNIFEI
jgi:hypothetical protein